MSSLEIGILKSCTVKEYSVFWWTFSHINYVENSDFRSKFVQLGRFVFCLHLKKKKNGLYISLFRAALGKDASSQKLPGLDIQLSFSDTFIKPQEVWFLPSNNILTAWYEQGLCDESPIQEENPYLRRYSVYCKLIVRKTLPNGLLLPVLSTGVKVSFSDMIRTDECMDDIIGAELDEPEDIAKEIKFYKFGEELGISSLKETCMDKIIKKIDQNSCLYVLKSFNYQKNSFIFRQCLDLFVLFFEDIRNTREWKKLVNENMLLASDILKDAFSKESNPLEDVCHTEEMMELAAGEQSPTCDVQKDASSEENEPLEDVCHSEELMEHADGDQSPACNVHKDASLENSEPLEDVCYSEELMEFKGGDHLSPVCNVDNDASSEDPEPLVSAIPEEPAVTGYISCHATDKGHIIWWSFPICELYDKHEVYGPTQHLEIDGCALSIYFHVVRRESCILISVHRVPDYDSALLHQHEEDLNVEFSFLTVDDRPRKGKMYKNMDIWYTSYSLQDDVQPESDFKTFSVVCKLSACCESNIPHSSGIQNTCNVTSVTNAQQFVEDDVLQPWNMQNDVPTSVEFEEIRIDGIKEAKEILFCLFEDELFSIDIALEIYRVAVEYKDLPLMDICQETLFSHVHTGTCLQFLKKCQDMKNTRLFEKSMETFIFFYDEVSVSAEWKDIRKYQFRLYQAIVMDAVNNGLSAADIMRSVVKKGPAVSIAENHPRDTYLNNGYGETMKIWGELFSPHCY